MRISVNLPEDDVRFLDAYASEHDLGSRSAALQQAVALLRGQWVSSAYEEAWTTWEASKEGTAWESTIGDGIL